MTNQNLLSISSLDAAKHFNVSHSEFLKTLKGVLKDSTLKEKKANFTKFKIDSKLAYLMTRTGYTLVAMRLETVEAYDFKVKMIKRFNEMESHLGL
ncbi:Rha family transcriptional regulator [Terasakiella sp.]|uniref:Rha family transcriptional regulator n=1 Tax=Terasakiella sp. TaxID=2034861 RepID=UPI003AA82112